MNYFEELKNQSYLDIFALSHIANDSCLLHDKSYNDALYLRLIIF